MPQQSDNRYWNQSPELVLIGLFGKVLCCVTMLPGCLIKVYHRQNIIRIIPYGMLR